jgi:hypothetical protein
MCLYICIRHSLLPSPCKQQQYSDIYRIGSSEKFFFFYPEIADVERNEIERKYERQKEKKKRERSCGLIINLFAFMHNDKYSEALDEHYLIVRKIKREGNTKIYFDYMLE